MELDATTFVLETANFLVLVWILNRLLYRPVLSAISARQERLAQSAAEAKRLQREATELSARYQERLTEWEREKEELRRQMLAQFGAERTRQEEELHRFLEKEREKGAVFDEKERQDRLLILEETAIRQGAGFASRLLKEVATPQLEQRLHALFFSALATFPRERLDAVASALRAAESPVRAVTAYPFPEEGRNELRRLLAELCGYSGQVEFDEEEGLVAGLQLKAGPWLLDATVKGELDLFAQAARHDAAGA